MEFLQAEIIMVIRRLKRFFKVGRTIAAVIKIIKINNFKEKIKFEIICKGINFWTNKMRPIIL